MKVGLQYFGRTLAISAIVTGILFFLNGLRLFGIVFLTAIPVSFICLIITGIKAATYHAKSGEYRMEHKKKAGSLIAVITACTLILLISGLFYSLRMTLDMPVAFSYRFGYNFSGNETIGIHPDKLPSLKGSKALTMHINFGAYSDDSRIIKAISNIYDFPQEKLFKYSDIYIPSKYRARNYSDLGYLVVIKNHAKKAGENIRYNGSGAIPYSWCIDIWIYDGEKIVTSTTIEGGYPSSTTLRSGSVIGSAPNKKVKEWVTAELENLIEK